MQYSYATRTAALLASPLRHIRDHARRHSFISLAEELPAQELFPVKLLDEAAHEVLTSGPAVLQYGDPEGYLPLREWLTAEWKSRKGMSVDPRQVLLTTGTQQAIDLVVRLMVDAEDPVLIEQPGSPGSLQVLSMQGARLIPVQAGAQGTDLEELERRMAADRPKLFIAAPSFSNPTGFLWTLEQRQQILSLCQKYNVLLVEDDSYGELHLHQNEQIPPSVAALDDEGRGGHVLYIGSFSKTIAPGLRTGWVTGHSSLIEGMSALKQLADMQSSSMNQRLLHHLLTDHRFRWHDHLELLNREYRVRLKLMLELLKRPFWKEVTYHVPEGGMYMWVRLPEGLESAALLKAVMPKGVAFMPGALCTTGNSGNSYIRLNFSHPGREELLMGMNLIGETITEFTVRRS